MKHTDERVVLDALRYCSGRELCDGCPGGGICGEDMLETAADCIEGMLTKIGVLAEVICGWKNRHVYFAVEGSPLEHMDDLPDEGLLALDVSDKKGYIPLIDDMGWGFAIYNRRLTHDELVRAGLRSAPID